MLKINQKVFNEANLIAENVQSLLARAAKEVDDGLLSGAQIALAWQGELVLLQSFGKAKDDSLFCIFSATKAVTSAAAWLLWESGDLNLAAKVADIVPEFAENGKEEVTVEQLFLHTCGFPSAPFLPLIWKNKEARRAKFASWKLNWKPGSCFEYHPSSSMHVIADIIERLSGVDFADFVYANIMHPLGLDNFYLGLPEEKTALVLDNEYVGQYMSASDYKKLNIPEPPVTEVTEEAIMAFNRFDFRATGIGGGGGICGAAELALFYQGLLHSGPFGKKPIWRSDTLKEALKIRSGKLVDPLYKVPANRALGLVIAGDEKRNLLGFGHTNSPQSFGHNGAGGRIAWADPVTGLSFAYCTNGHDRNNVRQGRRVVSLSNRAAICRLP